MSNPWKYDIRWTLSAKGVVEVQDVVGTLFHETGFLGPRVSLDNLKNQGRIDGISLLGLMSRDGITEGTIRIRCDLGCKRAAELAAALETIDMVGPCEAEIKVKEIRPVGESKQSYIEARAQELLEGLVRSSGGEAP